MRSIARYTFVASFLLGIGTAHAADVPGSKDPPFLKRYEGSEIVFSMTRAFDEYKLVVPDTSTPPKLVPETHEGEVTRILYRVPPGHTALELLRNYEQTVKGAGFSIAYEFLPCRSDGDALDAQNYLFGLVASTGFGGNPTVPFQRNSLPPQPDVPFCYFTAKGTKDGQDIAMTVAVGEKHNRDLAVNYTFKITNVAQPIVFKADEMVVMVDTVVAKAVENKMVEVKATDMADALATKGTVAIYGILFDVDKTEVKSESGKTLDEVATLL